MPAKLLAYPFIFWRRDSRRRGAAWSMRSCDEWQNGAQRVLAGTAGGLCAMRRATSHRSIVRRTPRILDGRPRIIFDGPQCRCYQLGPRCASSSILLCNQDNALRPLSHGSLSSITAASTLRVPPSPAGTARTCLDLTFKSFVKKYALFLDAGRGIPSQLAAVMTHPQMGGKSALLVPGP